MKRAVLAFLILAITSPCFAKYSGGSGTADDPYQIATAADLLALGANTGDYSSHFVLTADIDLDPNLPGNQIFTTAVIAHMVGAAFTGVFDGGGHRIANLTIVGALGHYLGLFGYVNGGEIKNLGLENVSINGGETGGLVGRNFDGSISNCYSTGAITSGANSDSLGGLVGENEYGTISNCYSTCTVIGGDDSGELGGLVGHNYAGTISGCHSTGAVTGGYEPYCLGGLVGGNVGTISNCYSTGNVAGGSALGGLVGYNFDSSINNCHSTGAVIGGDDSSDLGGLVGGDDGNISNCYSTGDVTGGDGSYSIGGLVGGSYGGSSISNCYFLITSGPNNGYGVPLTDEQMRQQASFVGWDFNDVWHICEVTNYPKLIWQMLLADFVCPDGVNFADYGFFANWWGAENCAANNNCDGADLTGDGNVDIDDLVAFSNDWLSGF
ncbi:MAG: GLUG motif-containing protein [Sedimentisphaerales bacterium]|jgi:hypothetical protein